MIRNTVFLAVASFVTAILVTGCGQPSTGPPPARPTPQVKTAHPLQKKIVEWNEFTGRIEAVNFVEIRSRVSGYLESVNFEEGEDVEQDTLLFVVDPRPFEAALAQAKAGQTEAEARLEQSKSQLAQAEAAKETANSQIVFAKADYERLQNIGNAVSRSEVEQARNEFRKSQASVDSSDAGIALANAAIATSAAAIESAKATVNEAELNLEYTNIKAPVKGRISRKYVTEGNLISGGSEQSTLLTTIVSLDPIYFTFDASEQQVLRFKRLVQEGQRLSVSDAKHPAYLALADEQGFPHQGYIDFVDNRFDPNTATMLARTVFPNPDGMLTPGMFGKIRIAYTAEYEALLLPDAAIGADQSESFVYLVGGDNQASRQVVETGPISHGLRVIRSGITADDLVVVEGLQRVRPGAPVDPQPATIIADADETIKYDSTPVKKE